MTSPLDPVTTKRTYYIPVMLGGAPQVCDTIEMFNGEDVQLVFNFVDQNGFDVDATGATLEFLAAQTNNTSVMRDNQAILKAFDTAIFDTQDFVVNLNKATLDFNAADALINEGGFLFQLRMSKGGTMIVAAYGYIRNAHFIVP